VLPVTRARCPAANPGVPEAPRRLVVPPPIPRGNFLDKTAFGLMHQGFLR